MALLNQSPFENIHTQLDRSVNPYVGMVSNSEDTGVKVLHGDSLVSIKGNWRESFRVKPEKLVLEIGCHLGSTICEYAKLLPNYGFIGVDVTFKRVVTTAQRAEKNRLKNLSVALFNAKFISDLFAEGELDDVLVFFPDPWEKRRQRKHRLFSQGFIDDLYKVTKPGGGVWFKTDHLNYSEEVVQAFSKSLFTPGESSSMVHKYPMETTFQRKFRLKGQSYYEHKWSNN